MGLDFFGYGKKHMQFTMSSNLAVESTKRLESIGVSMVLYLCALLVTAVVYVFANMRIERRHEHMRILIAAIMIVGLAPGLRDIGRLIDI